MKKSKRAKRNAAIRSGNYTPGRNVFGLKAETHFIVLERESAFEQMIDAMFQLDGKTIEFTVDLSCFDGYEDEKLEVMTKVQAALELKMKYRRAA